MSPLRHITALLLVSISCAAAESLTNPHPYRVINGNLYDFTAILRIAEHGRTLQTTPPYVIKGRVAGFISNMAAVIHYKGPAPIPMSATEFAAGPAEGIRRTSARQMAARGISPGKWVSYPPRLQRELLNAIRDLKFSKEIGDEQIVLIKDPPSYIAQNDPVFFFALPCAKTKFEDVAFQTFMIGTPATNFSSFKSIYRVSQHGVSSNRLQSPKAQ